MVVVVLLSPFHCKSLQALAAFDACSRLVLGRFIAFDACSRLVLVLLHAFMHVSLPGTGSLYVQVRMLQTSASARTRACACSLFWTCFLRLFVGCRMSLACLVRASARALVPAPCLFTGKPFHCLAQTCPGSLYVQVRMLQTSASAFGRFYACFTARTSS